MYVDFCSSTRKIGILVETGSVLDCHEGLYNQDRLYSPNFDKMGEEYFYIYNKTQRKCI